jgi:hypothetical protein
MKFLSVFSFVIHMTACVDFVRSGCPAIMTTLSTSTAVPQTTTVQPISSMEIFARMIITNPPDLVTAILTDPANRTIEQSELVANKTTQILQLVNSKKKISYLLGVNQFLFPLKLEMAIPGLKVSNIVLSAFHATEKRSVDQAL